MKVNKVKVAIEVAAVVVYNSNNQSNVLLINN